MPIDETLLIAAPMLQDYFVDKGNGFPLAAGTVSLFIDTNHTTFKNWYYQTGSSGGPYSFLPLNNPLTLSSVGTITDPNGNDVIPYFYPFDETQTPSAATVQKYYIEVRDVNNVLQFTRSNFPFNIADLVPTPAGNIEVDNLIINGEFWRNIGKFTLPTTDPDETTYRKISIDINGITHNFSYLPICPSQHDNFIMPDINIFKDTIDSTDLVNFVKFTIGDNTVVPVIPPYPDNVLPNDITPEYFLNLNCSSPGTETLKYIQIPIQSNVNSLSGYGPVHFVLNAFSVAGAAQITVKLFQFLGSGVQSPDPITLGTIQLTTAWQNYTFKLDNLPTAQGLTLGNGLDDGFYLQIGLPTGTTFNIGLAKPAVYLGSDIPTNDWSSYDEINAIISSPRTADVRVSLNSFFGTNKLGYAGWVPMSDGTISNSTATHQFISRANADVWPLYNLLWTYAQPFSSMLGGMPYNPICPMVDNALTPIAYGVTAGTTAIGDFNAGRSLFLTKMMGRVVSGTVPVTALLNNYFEPVTISTDSPTPPVPPGNIVVTYTGSNQPYFNGQAINFTATTLPGNIAKNIIYYVANIDYTTKKFNIATSYDAAIAGTPIVGFIDAGTAVVIYTCHAGVPIGENVHAQQVRELAAHTHGITMGDTFGGNTVVLAGGGTNPTQQTQTTGSGYPMNIIQLENYLFVWMKL